MIRKLTNISQQIQRQEVILNAHRRAMPGRYHSIKMRYRRRLSSPMTLLTSVAAGLLVGLLSQRPGRSGKPDPKSARQSWALIRAVAAPALLHIARTKGLQLIEHAMKR
jgi:hypothetical protein